MKDQAHHLRHIQRKVIQEARQEQLEASKAKEKKSGEEEEYAGELGDVEGVVDLDNRRKGLSECVRPMSQRDRFH